MLQSIRDKASGWIAWVIVILISIPFALWGIQEYIGNGSPTVVAEVNGEEISERVFRSRFREQMQRINANVNNPDMDLSFFEKQIKQDLISNMITEEALFQTVYDQGFRINDALLSTEIQRFPMFQKEGVFSEDLYRQLIGYRGMSPAAFEQDMRRSLAVSQLQQGIADSSVLTSVEKQSQQDLASQQRLLSYIQIDAKQFEEGASISDEDISAHYEASKARYFNPIKISIEYVVLKQSQLDSNIEVDDADLQQRYEENIEQYTTQPEWQARHILLNIDEPAQDAEVKKTAEALIVRLQAGEDFAELAKVESQDKASAEKGGDLGIVLLGDMVKPVEDALQALQVGAFSINPIKSRYGYHIIQLDTHTPAAVQPFEEIKAALSVSYKKEQAESKFFGLQEEFGNLAFEQPDSLQAIADTLGLEIENTALFAQQGGEYEGVLSNAKVRAVAFSAAVKDERQNSEIIEIESGHLLVLRLKDTQDAEAKPLSEVREQIQLTLKAKQAQIATEKLGSELLQKIRDNQDWQTLAEQHKLTWTARRWCQRNDACGQPLVVKTAFKMGSAENADGLSWYQGLKIGNGDYAIIALLDIKTESEADTSDANINASNIGQSEYQSLVKGIKERADIIIYQNQVNL